MTVVYHGLGYVGLTGAIHFAMAGEDVIGYDPDLTVVDAINNGVPKAGEFLGYLGAFDYRTKFRATTNFDEVKALPVHILAVPSEKNDNPYMVIVYKCLDRLLRTVPSGSILIIESTLQPGAIDNFLKAYSDVAASADQSITDRLRSGDVHLAICPRRDWFADARKSVASLVRIVGGLNDPSTRKAVEILSTVTPIDKIQPTTYQTAELTKALENALLHVPISLLNELALMYPNLNIAEAARLAVTHWRFESYGSLYLNIRSSGRCVPQGSNYILNGSPQQRPSQILREAKHMDEEMPATIARLLTSKARKRFGDGARAMILGIGYRPNFRDAGLSPGLHLAKELSLKNFIHDPIFGFAEIAAMQPNAEIKRDLSDGLLGYDIVVLATPHDVYLDLPFSQAWQPKDQIIFDPRGTWARFKPDFAKAGCELIQIGTPGWLSKAD